MVQLALSALTAASAFVAAAALTYLVWIVGNEIDRRQRS